MPSTGSSHLVEELRSAPAIASIAPTMVAIVTTPKGGIGGWSEQLAHSSQYIEAEQDEKRGENQRCSLTLCGFHPVTEDGADGD